MEKYLDWIIEYKDVTSWFLSNGQVKLEAKIYPNIETLHDFLRENNVYTTKLTHNTTGNVVIGYRDVITFNFAPSNMPYSDIEKNKSIFSVLRDFCSSRVYTTTKRAYAYIDTGSMDNTIERATKKVRKWASENLPNPRSELIKELKQKQLIPMETKIFCEILTKNL